VEDASVVMPCGVLIRRSATLWLKIVGSSAFMPKHTLVPHFKIPYGETNLHEQFSSWGFFLRPSKGKPTIDSR
jgi:hypothetical protein